MANEYRLIKEGRSPLIFRAKKEGTYSMPIADFKSHFPLSYGITPAPRMSIALKLYSLSNKEHEPISTERTTPPAWDTHTTTASSPP